MNRFTEFSARQHEAVRSFYANLVDQWDERTLQRAEAMAQSLERSGCPEPEGWVISEIAEGIPQMARFAVLRAILERAITPAVETEFDLDGEAQELATKAYRALTIEERRKLHTAIAKSLCFQFLNVIDEGYFNESLPSWSVIEIGPDDQPTGRTIGGLHESINELSDSNSQQHAIE